MIPFEADPTMYGFCIFFLIAFIALIILLRFTPEIAMLYSIFSIVAIIASIGVGLIIYTGSTEQVDIVVCNHIFDGDYMYIMGEDQQTYMISDSVLKLKIKNGETIHAVILNEWGYPYPKIYESGAPFVCGSGC